MKFTAPEPDTEVVAGEKLTFTFTINSYASTTTDYPDLSLLLMQKPPEQWYVRPKKIERDTKKPKNNEHFANSNCFQFCNVGFLDLQTVAIAFPASHLRKRSLAASLPSSLRTLAIGTIYIVRKILMVKRCVVYAIILFLPLLPPLPMLTNPR